MYVYGVGGGRVVSDSKSIFSDLIRVAVLLSTHGQIAQLLPIVLDGFLPKPCWKCTS